MADGVVSPEGQERNPTNEFEQRKVELEKYLEDARVGTPKFMSFWDLLDIKSAEETSMRHLTGEYLDDARHESSTRALFREQLVKNRIDVRRSEIPGYGEALLKLEAIRFGLRTAFHNESNKSNYPDPDETMNTYLLNLRESIAAKSVQPK